MAALPFRKTQTDQPSPPPLDRSQIASLASPLEEVVASPSDLPKLDAVEASGVVTDQYRPIDRLPDTVESLPALPATRRPFRDSLLKPQPMLPDAAAVTASELAQAAPDWNERQPLKYITAEPNPATEAIAMDAQDTSIREPADILPPHQMIAQQAGARGMPQREPASQFQRAQPPRRELQQRETRNKPRRRHFIYEPVD